MQKIRSIPSVTLADLKTAAQEGLLQGNATAQWHEDNLESFFSASGDVHQILIPIEREVVSNGYTFRLKVQAWSTIKYIALGYNSTGGDRFIHVKIPNPKQGEWFEFTVSHNDIIFKLQNNWDELPPRKVVALRVYIKGEFESRGELYLREASAWLEEGSKYINDFENSDFDAELVAVIKGYWKACYPEYSKQGNDYLENGSFPIGSYPAMINRTHWNPSASKPVTLRSPTTYRYSWHALNAVSVFLLAYDEAPELNSLIFSARELVADWIRESYFQIDEDQKYCWYDHGAAERTLVLVVMYELGLKYKFDHRTMARFFHVLVKHAQLMESEAFYASHQSTRYHNHAWFQDIALIASAITLKDQMDTQPWLSRGVERLSDQFAYLIKEEGGFSIFTENSIGYHGGILRIVKFASRLVSLEGKESKISNISSALEKWAATFVYPDGRMPAQGDTFGNPNPYSREEVALPDTWRQECINLPHCGYLIIKGGQQECPWMFSFLATNLNRTHKHEDDLSFTLWLDGVEWLTDPSFYSHEYEKEVPGFLRSAAAHNLLFFKDKEYSIDPSLDRVTFIAKETVPENNDKGVVSISATSYAYKGYEISRNMECAFGTSAFSLKCVDRFSARVKGGKHPEGFLSFHLGVGVCVEKKDNGRFALTHPASSKVLNLVFSSLTTNECFNVKGSVTGLGFMEKALTQQLLVTMMEGVECNWGMYVSE